MKGCEIVHSPQSVINLPCRSINYFSQPGLLRSPLLTLRFLLSPPHSQHMTLLAYISSPLLGGCTENLVVLGTAYSSQI
jgi:hypothetical protein